MNSSIGLPVLVADFGHAASESVKDGQHRTGHTKQNAQFNQDNPDMLAMMATRLLAEKRLIFKILPILKTGLKKPEQTLKSSHLKVNISA